MSHLLAAIHVKGAKATLTSGPVEVLDDCCSVLDPKRWHNTAFRERRWDGRVRLHRGREFPAGLSLLVRDKLLELGWQVNVLGWADSDPIDLSRLSPAYLAPAITELWPHQMDCIRALLQARRGVVQSPTGSGKTPMIAAVARYLLEEYAWESLVVVPKKGLLRQTVAAFESLFDGDIAVGMYGDGVHRPGVITIGTAQTLIGFKPRMRKQRGSLRRELLPADQALLALLKRVNVLFLDETHHASADTWQEIVQVSQAERRYGLSGTPIKNEHLADLKLLGATGPVLHRVRADVVIASGLASRPKIVMVAARAASGPDLPEERTLVTNPVSGVAYERIKPLAYPAAYVAGVMENEAHNAAVIRTLVWLVDQGRQTLVLCRRKAHYRHLVELAEQTGIQFMSVWGDTATEDRDVAKRSLNDRSIQAVIATTIWDEGEDVPSLDAVVFAEGVRASTNALQRVGRGMRRGGDNEVWVVDFVPLCHPKLKDHAVERCLAYEREGYDVRVLEVWPEKSQATPDDLLPFNAWDVD